MSTSLSAIRNALSAARSQTYTSARSMPRDFYTSNEFLDLEKSSLFAMEWNCIGRVEEIPNPGDYMAFQLCDEPLLATRGNDAQIRVMSNVCRHRGTLLASASGNSQHIVCPYHHWSYELDGKLARAPRMEEHTDFDMSSCRLPEFKSEIWLGFIFVSLNPHAKPLSPQLQQLEGLIGNYHMEEMQARFVGDEVWTTNWKCFVENFMEGYHLSPLHKATLHPVNPTRLCTHYPPSDVHFGYHAGFSPDLPRSTKGHPDLQDHEVDNCVMFSIPPGLVSGCAGDYSSFICVQPESVDRVRLKMGLLFYGDHWTQETIDHAVELFHRTNAEDKEVLARMSKGLKSKSHQVGALSSSNFEGPLLDFYKYLDSKLSPVLGA